MLLTPLRVSLDTLKIKAASASSLCLGSRLEPELILHPLRLEGKRHLESSILLVLIVLVVVALLGLPVLGKSRSQSGTLAYIKSCMDCYPF